MSKRIIKKKAKQLQAILDSLYGQTVPIKERLLLTRKARNIVGTYYCDFVRLKARHLNYNHIYVINGPCGPWLPKYFCPFGFKNGSNIYELDVMACSGRFTKAEMDFHAEVMGW